MSEKARLTIDQVALLAGVSRSVVSRVLNRHPSVSDEARERVLRVIGQYSYRPSSVARSLATHRTFEICAIAPRRRDDALANGFWPLLHLGIFEQCIRRGYFVSLTLVSVDTADEISRRILNEHAFDGYLLITQEVTRLVTPSLRRTGAPVVVIGLDPATPDVNAIDIDNFDGAYKATTHLLRLGHRRINLILGDLHMQESIDRREGYRRAFVDAGVPPDEGCVAVGSYAAETGYQAMKAWIDAGERPTAVFCASDAIAQGVLLALYRAGIPVPAGMAVVGFDGLPGSMYTTPPLTTIRQPIYEKGEQAANLLIDQIEGRSKGPVQVKLQAELVIRESCGATLARGAG